MTTYLLQQAETLSGRVTVYLHSEYSGLLIPSFPTLDLTKLELTERVDVQAGSIEIPNMDFAFIDDYSHYPEGFWFKVLAGKAQIQVMLNDGHGDECFFWGSVTGETTIEEQSLIFSAERRLGTFTCASVLFKLKDVTIAQLSTEAEEHDYPTPGTIDPGWPCWYIKIVDVIASMIKLCFEQSFSTSDVELEGADFQYRLNPPAGWWELDDIYMLRTASRMWCDGYLGTGYAGQFQFVWKDRFRDCFDLLAHLCRAVGMVPRWRYYNGRHKIQLIARGTSFSTPLVLPTPISSQITLRAEPTVFCTEARRTQTSLRQHPSGVYNVNKGIVLTGAPPQPISAEFSATLDFVNAFWNWGNVPIIPDPNWLEMGEWLMVGPNLFTAPFEVRGMRVWDRSTLSYSSEYMYHAEAHARYWYSMLSKEGKRYERSYGVMRASDGVTDSQSNLHVLRKTTIDSKTYLATEVIKRLSDGTSTVTWVEL